MNPKVDAYLTVGNETRVSKFLKPTVEVPVAGRFSVELPDGRKYSGELRYTEDFVSGIVRAFSEVGEFFSGKLYSGTTRLDVSTAGLLPKDVVGNIASFVPTSELETFVQESGAQDLNALTQKRMKIARISDPYKKGYESGLIGDFEYVITSSELSRDKYQLFEGLVRGALESKLYKQLTKYRDSIYLEPVEIENEEPHYKAMLLISGYRHYELDDDTAKAISNFGLDRSVYQYLLKKLTLAEIDVLLRNSVRDHTVILDLVVGEYQILGIDVWKKYSKYVDLVTATLSISTIEKLLDHDQITTEQAVELFVASLENSLLDLGLYSMMLEKTPDQVTVRDRLVNFFLNQRDSRDKFVSLAILDQCPEVIEYVADLVDRREYKEIYSFISDCPVHTDWLAPVLATGDSEVRAIAVLTLSIESSLELLKQDSDKIIDLMLNHGTAEDIGNIGAYIGRYVTKKFVDKWISIHTGWNRGQLIKLLKDPEITDEQGSVILNKLAEVNDVELYAWPIPERFLVEALRSGLISHEQVADLISDYTVVLERNVLRDLIDELYSVDPGMLRDLLWRIERRGHGDARQIVELISSYI